MSSDFWSHWYRWNAFFVGDDFLRKTSLRTLCTELQCLQCTAVTLRSWLAAGGHLISLLKRKPMTRDMQQVEKYNSVSQSWCTYKHIHIQTSVSCCAVLLRFTKLFYNVKLIEVLNSPEGHYGILISSRVVILLFYIYEAFFIM